MCKFCVEHGEGERWYLQAKNYAYDLDSDARRREYVIGFIGGFAESRANAIAWMERFDALPAPISRAGKSLVTNRMQKHHFGQPVPIEECERILGLATSITAIPCICRMHEPGKNADEVCILVTTKPVDEHLQKGFEGYADGPDLGDFHTMTPAQTMDLLRQCEKQGLMHSIWTFETPWAAAICNCNMESGCMAMKLTQGFDMKLMWRGEWVAQMDEERCSSCGACAKRCPFDAIESSRGGRTRVSVEGCWGCGVCRSACREDALSLVDRRSVPAVANLW